MHNMHTLKEPERGATTPSNNSLRLTYNMHTLKEPERGATTPSNNSLRLTHTLKEPLSVEQRLLATTHCRHALHVHTHVHVHTGTDTLDGSQTRKPDVSRFHTEAPLQTAIEESNAEA